MSTAAAAALLLGVIAYAVFGGADFGAGLWDLTAGSSARGTSARALIHRSMAPVWEANHTWLIFCLVVFWSAFPSAFAAVMSTLYLPIGMAALGMVLRGAGFAFRKVVVRQDSRRLAGVMFAIPSVITPFFLGATGGAIVTGQVPDAGNGSPVTSWLSPMPVATGVLAVVVCAYLAAVFLTADARRVGDPLVEAWFRRRALAAAVAAGAVSTAALVVLHTEAPAIFSRLTGPLAAIPAGSVVAGALALALLKAAPPRVVQLLGITAVTLLVLGWGASQYPNLLGTHTTIAAAAAPAASLTFLLVVVAVAIVLVVPSLALLYRLQQRSQLEG